MADLPTVGGAYGGLKLAYCVGKCSVEYADRRRRGATGTRDQERRRFMACIARCLSPVDLPERGTGDDE